VLFTAGDQVPVILLFEVVGSVNDPPLQIGATWVNVGVIMTVEEGIASVIESVHPIEDVVTTEYEPGQALVNDEPVPTTVPVELYHV
jgi:hypothetical protein